MVDSKTVAVVTEGPEVLLGEHRIFGGWVAYLRILSMSGSICRALPFHLCNLLQEKINEDLVLDCHLPSFWNARKRWEHGREQLQGQWNDTGEEEVMPAAKISPCSCILPLCVCCLWLCVFLYIFQLSYGHLPTILNKSITDSAQKIKCMFSL